MTARPIVDADLGVLVDLENRVFPGDRLTRRDFRHAIRSTATVSLASGRPGTPDGYILLQTRKGARVGRITSVAVTPESAGRGIARDLLGAAEREAAERGCDRIRLEVRADNDRAAALYERAGYRRFAEVADYYDDGEAAWRYEKSLAAPP